MSKHTLELRIPRLLSFFRSPSTQDIWNNPHTLGNMDKYEKIRSSSHSPRSPRSSASSRFDTRPQWRQNRVCYILEGLGTLIVLRLRSLIIIALLLIITSGVLTLKPVRPAKAQNNIGLLASYRKTLSDRISVVAF